MNTKGLIGVGKMSKFTKLYTQLAKQLGIALPILLAVFISGQTFAGPLNLANNVLEVSSGVEPNVMLLHDDSASMDSMMITRESRGNLNVAGREYRYTHDDIGVASGKQAPAVNRNNRNTPTEEYLKAQGVDTTNLGFWRAWNSDYNFIYYNPRVTYRPWPGKNNVPTDYMDMSETNALFDPYDPTANGLDLTTVTTYPAQCDAAECAAVGLSNFTVTDFYPAMYYLWGTDTNSDGFADTNGDTNNDGIPDADEPHQLIEIRSSGCTTNAICPSSFTRPKLNTSTGFGRFDCATDNGDGTVTCTYNEEIQNFANWFSYYRKRDLAAKAGLSNAVNNATAARIGYATIGNHNNVATEALTVNPSDPSGLSNKNTLLTNIQKSAPLGGVGTQLRRMLHESGRYLSCRDENLFGTANSSPGAANCPVLAAPQGACQANHSILMTDGDYNRDPTSSTDNPNSHTTFASEINNADNDSPGSDWDSPVFGQSSLDPILDPSDTLADVAMHYYENDLFCTGAGCVLNTNALNNEVPANQVDVDGHDQTPPFRIDDKMHQHMKTHTISFGVPGTGAVSPDDFDSLLTDINNPGPWTDPAAGAPEKIDDVIHAAFNGRGLHRGANNPVKLEKDLNEIFELIGVGAGAASAVAFNSQTLQSNSVVYRAFFNNNTNSGDLVAQRINADGTLNVDTNGNDIFEWSASDELDIITGTNSDSRVIITYDDNGSSSQGVAFQWTGASTITGPRTTAGTQMNLLDLPIPANVSNVGDERLNYLRGHSANEGLVFDDGEFRVRSESKLGDIVHSTPVFVGEPPFTGRITSAFPGVAPDDPNELYSKFQSDNANRQEVVYVGANDGMLHGFNATTGRELFAYVPNIVFENLSDLTNPGYTHQFYVDLTPSINDIYMGGAWHSVLVGGLGNGGRGYYALDITNPSNFTSEANAANQVLWEFTDADDVDLGFSFSQPLIAMSNADTDADGEHEWVAIFGNGYNSTSADGDAKLFVLFIEEGTDGVWSTTDYVEINTEIGKAEFAAETGVATPNGIGGIRGIDVDGNGTVDRVYAGDLLGNLHVFDISSSSETTWANSSSRRVLFQARYDTNPTNRSSNGKVQPITTKPIVVSHPTSDYLVLFATGSWMTDEDATSTDIQSIYGVWDRGTTTSVVMSDADNELVEQEFTNIANQEHGFTVRTLSNNTVDYDDTSSPRTMGWYIDLDVPPAGSTTGVEHPGERAVRNLQLRGDFLFVNTVIPKSSNPCNTGAGGFELAINPITGGSGIEIVFDINADGEFDSDDNVNNVASPANIVSGIQFDGATPSDAAFIGHYRVTQLSDKSARIMGTNTEESSKLGRNSWREIILH